VQRIVGVGIFSLHLVPIWMIKPCHAFAFVSFDDASGLRANLSLSQSALFYGTTSSSYI
jgi:hypothetical protein